MLLAAPQVPTLRTISEDMDKVKLGSSNPKGAIYDTGLAKYIINFDKFLNRLGDTARGEKLREINANKQSSFDF